jgi:drug/metabolite transporter (DMT)-like permease
MTRSVWIAFSTLCLLSASAWAATSFRPSRLPSLEEQGLLLLVLGLGGVPFAVRGVPSANRGRARLRLAMAGLGFFAVPALAIEFASGYVPEISRSALFAMVPVVVIVVLSASEIGASGERGAIRSLVPALIGLSGLLLLLPLDFSGGNRGRLMLAIVAVAVIVAGASSVWLFRLLQGVSLSQSVMLVCIPNAALLLIAGAGTGSLVWDAADLGSLFSPASLIDLAEVLLLLWLLPRMPPVAFSSRYLVIPLVTVLEGYLLMRPELTVRIGGGFVLLAVGSALLLFPQRSDEDIVLSLR